MNFSRSALGSSLRHVFIVVGFVLALDGAALGSPSVDELGIQGAGFVVLRDGGGIGDGRRAEGSGSEAWHGGVEMRGASS